MRALPASTPERRFFFSGWFSAQELASLPGNLPASHAQPLFSLIVVSLRAKPPLQPAARVASVFPPSLASSDFSLGGGWSPDQEGGEPAAARLLPAASLLFLSPFSLPLPRRKLSLTLSRDVPSTAGASGCSQQPQASGLVSPKSATRRWGGRLQESGGGALRPPSAD